MEIFNYLTVLGGELTGFHWPFGLVLTPKPGNLDLMNRCYRSFLGCMNLAHFSLMCHSNFTHFTSITEI